MMLKKKEINEIREHLERAKNPVFYYDNDCDGLCSFILLRKLIGRGKGVVIRNYPDLNASYAHKARELNADYVFVLDKPLISMEFVQEIKELGIPLVWIDHHHMEEEAEFDKLENVFVYKGDEPTTAIAYSVSGRKEDLWLALIGCVSDHFMPKFAKEFAKEHPELWKKGIKEPFEAYFETGLGNIARALNFGLKDSITNVVQMQNHLIECKSASDVLEEVNSNLALRKKYKELREKYNALLERAKNEVSGKLIFFSYSGEMSLSAELSNELIHIYPDKYVVIAYLRQGLVNLSLRGKKVLKIFEKLKGEISGLEGGGHEDAVGGRVSAGELDNFKKALEKLL